MASRFLAPLASAALLVTALTTLPAAASTTQSGYTPEQVCGSGFGKVTGGTQPVTDREGIIRGYVYLLYSARTGENCVVTIKSSFVGQPTLTSATLYRQTTGKSPRTDRFVDEKYYRYYAGPVKAQAKDMCVAFHGSVNSTRDNEGFSMFTIQGRGGSTGYGNCGGQDRRRRGNT